ncbi:hypothetical protein CTAM01_00690, partial [Colletotrichum tamarilloi]
HSIAILLLTCQSSLFPQRGGWALLAKRGWERTGMRRKRTGLAGPPERTRGSSSLQPPASTKGPSDGGGQTQSRAPKK